MSATWQEQLRSIESEEERELFSVLRRYGTLKVYTPQDVQRPCELTLRIIPSDPEFPYQLENGLLIHVHVPSIYPKELIQFKIECDVAIIQKKYATKIAQELCDRQALFPGQLVLRKTLTWLDNNLKHIISHKSQPSTQQAIEPVPQANEVTVAQAVHDAQDTKDATSIPRAKKKKCRFFEQGKCKNGDHCKFAHLTKGNAIQSSVTSVAAGESECTSTADFSVPNTTKDIDDKFECKSSPSAQSTATTMKKPKKMKVKGSHPPSLAGHATGTTVIDLIHPTEKDGDKRQARNRGESKSRKKKPDGESDSTTSKLKVCKFHLTRTCSKGDMCRFEHPSPQLEVEDSNKPSVDQLGDATPIQPSTQWEDDVWTSHQQSQLDKALKQYPAGSVDAKTRWENIAECVDGKSMKGCIKRFKLLSEYVKTKGLPPPHSAKSSQAVQSPPKSMSPSVSTKSYANAATTVKTSEDEDEIGSTDSRIIPAHQRTKLDLEVDDKAIHIQLDSLFLHQIDTLQLHAWKCSFQCAQCPLAFDSILTLTNNTVRQWCRRCSVLQNVELRPVLMHSANEIAVNLTIINCTLVDLMPPSIFLAICSSCSEEGLIPLVPRIRSEVACRKCHVKMAVECKAFTITNQSSNHFVDHSQPKMKKKLIKEDLVVGQPLPNQGRCSHYSKSYRWFRFQCCKKAYPCDICHSKSTCPDADKGIFASRFICGLCSREHPSQIKECPCGNVLGASNTSVHWEGGKGCRDASRMATTDSRKFQGVAKTKSMKFKRVGAEAKKRREQKMTSKQGTAES